MSNTVIDHVEKMVGTNPTKKELKIVIEDLYEWLNSQTSLIVGRPSSKQKTKDKELRFEILETILDLEKMLKKK